MMVAEANRIIFVTYLTGFSLKHIIKEFPDGLPSPPPSYLI
jgi:hypothetical protein